MPIVNLFASMYAKLNVSPDFEPLLHEGVGDEVLAEERRSRIRPTCHVSWLSRSFDAVGKMNSTGLRRQRHTPDAARPAGQRVEAILARLLRMTRKGRP